MIDRWAGKLAGYLLREYGSAQEFNRATDGMTWDEIVAFIRKKEKEAKMADSYPNHERFCTVADLSRLNESKAWPGTEQPSDGVQSQVGRSLDQLAESVARICDRIHLLRNRLEPVLAPERPCANVCEKAADHGVPLARGIDAVVAEVRGQADFLDDILLRLAL